MTAAHIGLTPAEQAALDAAYLKLNPKPKAKPLRLIDRLVHPRHAA